MNSVTEKLQILESLNALDKSQTEKVLAYIKGMMKAPNAEEIEYKRSKREAMKEIRQALNGSRRLKLSM
jgi:hypothetical protein